MADEWKRVLTGLGGRWGALGPGQRLVLGSLVAAAAGTILVSVIMAKHATYSVLYAGLDAEQANAVVEHLRDTKVPYRLADSGRTIQVPDDKVYGARLDLAGEGLPGTTDTGYEIFDRRGFGLTNFMQQINYRRALEGELVRTIRELDAVVSARVHLVIPERSLFMDDERRPSASVMLRLRPGAQLSRKQTQGITYLVSGSVEGLTPDRVNLVDEYGTLLAGGRAPDAIDGDGSSRLEVKSSVENWLEAKAQTLLDRVVGPGKSVVRVTAELDFERIEKEIETYDPDNVVVRSEELNEQTQGEGGGQTRNSVTNYEINRTVEKLVKAPGALDRLTIAVTVDGRYQEAAAAGKGKDKDAQPVFVRRTDAELRDLGAVVKNAVGFDGRRGDLFHIACIQFEDGYLVEEQEEMERVDRQMLFQTLLRYGLLAAGIALAAFVLLKIARAMARTFEQVRLAPTEAGGAPGLDVGAGTRAQVGALIEQVNRTTRAKPQESAAVIRTMIAEGD